MKKILIIGAGGSLAQYVIEAIKPLPGAEFTLFVRDKNRLSKNITDSCKVVEGDAMNFSSVPAGFSHKYFLNIKL